MNTYKNAANKRLEIGDVKLAYRELGPIDGEIVLLLNHWGAVLDNFDPYIVDAIAQNYRVIALDYRGIGLSEGVSPVSMDDISNDVIAFIKELNLQKVNLFGFSLGGMVAQDVVLKAPDLISKLILTGTGPAGGVGIKDVGAVSWPLIIKALLTFKDPKYNLFFTRSDASVRAAKDYLARLKERRIDRDRGPSPRAFINQLKVVEAWGKLAQQDLSLINIPVLIANGDNDLMVPTENSHDMAKRIKNSELIIYKDAGHGGIFQYHEEFVNALLTFLAK